ncbi:cupin domain-containing protein [Pararhizobium mangrovi]|uniref:Cupin domain-containing protein n=1 Tax=Pararhizobium mangrovi TaxID=2590452 RepID=A0A506U657_9HYPH|nr:cupin domain-containing protein [Pararhizobium mangrovi]TPW28968.1 cupin domain-containing protein [Pararhizobium mangrovi]
MREKAEATVLVDDERVRVTRFAFAPGAETGHHVHEHDYVVTPVTDCAMLIEAPDGSSRTVTMAAGEAYRRDKGVEHNVVNDGERPMTFVETELK